MPVVPVQIEPRGSQVPTGVTIGAQRRISSAPGTQGTPLQHWSANWQTWPAEMQQPGFDPSHPVGQGGVIGPPKQRMIPLESGLQSACPETPPWVWPVSGSIQQQFWEAFTVPPPPQMLPGGLQFWPPLQVGGEEVFFFSHKTP